MRTRYPLIGGHSAGRSVEFDGPAPVFLAVAYRVPADPLDFPPEPDMITLGIETYELCEILLDPGPPVRAYIGPDLPKYPPIPTTGGTLPV